MYQCFIDFFEKVLIQLTQVKEVARLVLAESA